VDVEGLGISRPTVVAGSSGDVMGGLGMIDSVGWGRVGGAGGAGGVETEAQAKNASGLARA